ncbi:MAG TPA: hypothetical protein VM778_11185 [Gemmatimonadota bacterium]|nr:hypothetical protein [Gemmatimonadota bacterium]
MGRSDGLRTIFSIFLGLMVTAFVGVGAYTFHPPPEELDARVRDLSRDEQAIRNSKPPDELTPADRQRLQEMTDRQNALHDAATAAREDWGRSTSIILIVFATLAMAVSLVRADRLPVISNGLLLGGVFTMLYGVGWIVATGTAIPRFIVMTIALAITLVLGYVRFVRGGTATPGPAPADGAVADVDRRLRELEERMNDAANALGRRGES